jgi:hypothetical protein
MASTKGTGKLLDSRNGDFFEKCPFCGVTFGSGGFLPLVRLRIREK